MGEIDKGKISSSITPAFVGNRQLEILRTIVDEYVSSQEPVGSQLISRKSGLGVSSATIRNDMAHLEEVGLITQPHTSAGRIPTSSGYRVFVDQLATVKPLSKAERKAIENFLDGAVDLDDAVLRTVKLLSQVTKQIAVVQYPSLSKSEIKHIDIVQINPYRLILVVISSQGRVEQSTLEIPLVLSDVQIAQIQSRISRLMIGQSLSQISHNIVTFQSELPSELITTFGLICTALMEMMYEKPEEKVVMAGTANFARTHHDDPEALHTVLQALEEQVVLLKLISNSSQAPRVQIGEEIAEPALTATSVISMGYGSDGNHLGSIGILGPTRMDYSTSISAVSAVAQYIGEYLGE
jgi:heat-inducible transcriptional repressor